MIKRILAYGDSNTWGYISGTLNRETFYYERYAENIRWTGALQQLLGKEFQIIEEGLPGRTIATHDPFMRGLHGIDYFYPCLLSHKPLDCIIIMLGTNDLKPAYQLTPKQITEQLAAMCQLVIDNYKNHPASTPHILLIAPPKIDSNRLHADMLNFYLGADTHSKELSHYFAKLAEKENYLFCDASDLTLSEQSDGLHLDETAHLQLANLLAPIISNALKNE